ncbi:MAG: hypothetical protein PF447_00810 [Spirochaetaceae bacterium]|nr:hypothetical protein [Spirochaetaceae bacterium]
MKKIINPILIILLSMAAIACLSQPQVQSELKMLADVDPIPLGSSSIGVMKMLDRSLKEVESEIILHPRNNMLTLIVKDGAANTHILHLDEFSRTAYIMGLQEYMESFDAHSLVDDKRVTEDLYGSFKAMHQWGLIGINAEGMTTVDLGYLFKDESPYFTLTINDKKITLENSNTVRGTTVLKLYFTRNQALALGEYFKQENIQGFIDQLEAQGEFNDMRPDEY